MLNSITIMSCLLKSNEFRERWSHQIKALWNKYNIFSSLQVGDENNMHKSSCQLPEP